MKQLTNQTSKHTWEKEKDSYFSECLKCGLRKKIGKKKFFLKDGSDRLEYSTVYFLSDGEIVENKGCISIKEPKLF